jgi:hypothetical protein
MSAISRNSEGGGEDMSELRTQYFGTLGFTESETTKLKAALKRAYELRNFEIEHYWKRATYFWAFQVAIFAAFGLLWKDLATGPVTVAGSVPVANPWGPVTVALAGLGILTAVANALSARGSTFWQNNWEKHIDMLENEIEGRLYKTVWLIGGKVSFSVSRINQYLNYYFVVFWVFVAVYVALRFVAPPDWPGWMSSIYVLFVAVIILVGVVFLLAQTTNTRRATLPQANGSHSNEEIKRDWEWL